MTKRVVVQMSDQCHVVLKQYCAFVGMTMSDVLYHCTRMQFHKQARSCNMMTELFSRLGIKLDPRASKPCYSYRCFGCRHAMACRTGLYDGVVELTESCIERDLVKPVAMAELNALQDEANQTPQFPEALAAEKEISLEEMALQCGLTRQELITRACKKYYREIEIQKRHSQCD